MQTALRTLALTSLAMTCVPAFATIDTVAPSSERINLGRGVHDNHINKLGLPEGVANTYCKFIVPNIVSPIVRMEWAGQTVVHQPLSFVARVKSRMTTHGFFEQTMKLYSFVTQSYNTFDSAPINTDYRVYELTGNGHLIQYIGAQGQVVMQYEVRQRGPSASNLPCVQVDLANWIVSN